MTTRKIISLKVVTAPSVGIVLDAPPVLVASDECRTILLHAEDGQVLIRCTECETYNTPDL